MSLPPLCLAVVWGDEQVVWAFFPLNTNWRFFLFLLSEVLGDLVGVLAMFFLSNEVTPCLLIPSANEFLRFPALDFYPIAPLIPLDDEWLCCLDLKSSSSEQGLLISALRGRYERRGLLDFYCLLLGTMTALLLLPKLPTSAEGGGWVPLLWLKIPFFFWLSSAFAEEALLVCYFSSISIRSWRARDIFCCSLKSLACPFTVMATSANLDS